MMTTPRLRTTSPPGQDDLVPDSMNLVHEWHADDVAFELWVYGQIGFILADPLRRFEVAGQVDICGDQMTIIWCGAITDRPQPWLNAQRAVAARAHFGGTNE